MKNIAVGALKGGYILAIAIATAFTFFACAEPSNDPKDFIDPVKYDEKLVPELIALYYKIVGAFCRNIRIGNIFQLGNEFLIVFIRWICLYF